MEQLLVREIELVSGGVYRNNDADGPPPVPKSNPWDVKPVKN